MQQSEVPLHSLRLLVQACAGVLLGALVAMLISVSFFKVGGKGLNIPDEILPWNTNNILFKPREKSFYLLSMALGWLGAYIASAKVWRASVLAILGMLFLALPIITFLAHKILQLDQYWWLLGLVTGISLIAMLMMMRRSQAYVPGRMNDQPIAWSWKYYLLCTVIIVLVVIPYSFTELALRVGMEMHVVSFMIGPALYFLGNHLLPGLDYFTQYSLGMGWLFSFFLGQSAEQTILNYTYFVIAMIGLFYLQLLVALLWLYRSRVTALMVTLVSLILLFHTDRHFFDPSSSILRYPLLVTTAAALSYWLTTKRSWFAALLLSSSLALAIFFNTETGIISMVAVAAASILSAPSWKRMLLPVCAILAASIVIFVLVLLTVFGTQIFQVEFFTSLIKPFLIYGKVGFGGWLINWSFADFNWFYNWVAPGIAIATLALIVRATEIDDVARPRMAMLAFFTIAGLLMMAKFINMSIIAVWQVNALGFLIALGWWLQILTRHASLVGLGKPVMAMVTLGILVLLTLTDDARNPSEYAMRSWIKYPSLLKGVVVASDHPHLQSMADIPAKRDIELIAKFTAAREPVAIIGLHDWAYLVGAHRPPLMAFLPSVTIFTKTQLTTTSQRLLKTKYLFLLKSKQSNEPLIEGALHDVLMPDFHKHYVLEAEGVHLNVWRRVGAMENQK